MGNKNVQAAPQGAGALGGARQQNPPVGNTSKENVMERVKEEVVVAKMELLDKSIIPVVRGVAQLLELDESLLLREVLLLESGCLAISCYYKQDEIIGTEDLIERIAKILIDHEAWDSYSPDAPSARKYAAAVVLWLLLARFRLGGLVRSDCPLFSDSVAAAITWFIATRVAKPISDALVRVLSQDISGLGPLCVRKSQ